MEQTRLIRLQGAGNFREIGGLYGEQGRLFKSGLLYRSDDLSRLTRQDLARLEQLGLRLVLDLRTPNESKSNQDRLPALPALRYQRVSFYHRHGDLSGRAMVATFWGQARRFDFRQFILDYYNDIVFRHTAQIGEIFDLLCSAENYPALIHCTAGKDRTGVLAALIQLLAGVPFSDVLNDYILSNTLTAARQRTALRLLRLVTLFQVTPERAQPVFEVHPDYLEAILDEIQSRFGGVTEYLEQACGVNLACLNQMKQFWLA